LIEIVVVLIIIGLIAAGSIATVVLTSSERTLRNQSSEIEMLAKKARTTAILRQKPYAIVFRMNSIELLPLPQTNEYERTTALGNQIGGSSSDGETRTDLYQSIKIDSSIRLTIRQWNTASFIAPTENKFPVWRFDPDGL
jgi:type II secretory pathway pseudopilin PulG